MMNDDIYNLNTYIKTFNDVYDLLQREDERIKVKSEDKYSIKDVIFGHYTYESKNRIDANELLHKMLKDIDKDNWILSYSSIWQFCQFVRYAEKVIFYNNDITNRLYVDSDINSLDKREFILNHDDFSVLFKLEEVNKMNVIKLCVKRNFGKKMNNEFIIINAGLDFKDVSDQYLIITINKLLSSAMKNTINSIFSSLIYDNYMRS